MSLATSTSLPTLLFAAFAAVALAGCGLSAATDADTRRSALREQNDGDGDPHA